MRPRETGRKILVLKNRETGGIAKQGARNRGVRLYYWWSWNQVPCHEEFLNYLRSNIVFSTMKKTIVDSSDILGNINICENDSHSWQQPPGPDDQFSSISVYLHNKLFFFQVLNSIIIKFIRQKMYTQYFSKFIRQTSNTLFTSGQIYIYPIKRYQLKDIV